jgi:transcriptional regulator with PAS, ATPase and Fis domain
MNDRAYPNSILTEIDRMEKNPVAYLSAKPGKNLLSPIEKIERKLVLAWANNLVINPEKTLNLSNEILPMVNKDLNPHLYAQVQLIRANANFLLMRFPEMKSCLDEAHDAARHSQVIYTNLAINLSYASYYAQTQDTAKAEQFALKALNLVEMVEEPYLRVDILWRLATVYHFIRKYDVALFYLVDCFRLCLQNSFKLKALQISVELVSLYSRLNNYAQAENLYQIGVELEIELGLPVFKIGLNFNYGLMHKLQRKLPEAIHYYETSLELFQTANLNMPNMQFNIFNNLANALAEHGEGERALSYHEQAEKLAVKMKNMALQMQSSTNIALANVAVKKYDEVLPRLKKPIAYYRKTKNWELLIKALRTEGFFYQETKNHKKGFATMCRLDEAQIKLVAQLRADFALHKNLLIDAHHEDTRNLKTRYELAEQRLEQTLPNTYIGSSSASRSVVENALLASLYPDTCVFIEGESGTGKEIIAKMIHANSIRSDKPYVTVNCASISPSLFESEFFGHVRGSFTGANQDKQGFFQLADKGTLFLDEISEIPMEFQAKLLRAIDTKTIIPVGKGNEEKINCKIITATNNNIHKLIIENKFRLDLFHRINTIEIRISALRDRIEDLPDLVNYYVERFASETKKRKPRIAKGFLERLSTYPFPGNVRELKNYIERLFVMHYRPVWEASILDNINTLSTIQQSTTLHTGSDIKSIEAQLIRDALLKCEGKQKAAAKLLHLTESTLSRKIKRLGIKG